MASCWSPKSKTPDYAGAKAFVEQLLATLPDTLTYHGPHHTLDQVLPWSERLGKEEGISEEDMLIVTTAALFHDVGYKKQYKDNEPIGKEIAEEELPKFGYSKEQIDKIGQCIMATHVPQQPKDLLSQIVCDADLANLGQETFFLFSEKLRLELGKQGVSIPFSKWQRDNIKFVESHSYHTKSAKKLFGPTKEANIKELKELCG